MIFFYVQHLLGTGHVHRIRLIVDELVRRGVATAVVTGGMPSPAFAVEGCEWIQLDPVRSDGLDFARLIDAHGRVVDEALMMRRKRKLLGEFERLEPSLVVIETYPFGRRKFRDEINALLQKCRARPHRPVVVSSIRDILQPRGERREQETLALIDEFFDAVLVHGDPAVVPLGATFSLADRIVEKTVYTGYIAPPPVPRTLVEASAEGEIIVSAGGGAAGLRLYEAAIEAARIASKPHGWRVLVGHGIEESEFRGLSRRAPENVLVERNRADFRELIAASAMLISQAGYNTIADIMVTGVPSLLVPFEGGGEMEQLERARRFEALGRCHMIREAELTADALARAGAAVLGEPEPVLPAMDLAGISHCADWLERRAVNY